MAADKLDVAEGRRLYDAVRLLMAEGKDYRRAAAALHDWMDDNIDALLTAAEEMPQLREQYATELTHCKVLREEMDALQEELDQAVRERDEAQDAVRVWNERWNKAQDELDVFRTTQFREDWWRTKAEFSEAALDSLRAELKRERARAEAGARDSARLEHVFPRTVENQTYSGRGVVKFVFFAPEGKSVGQHVTLREAIDAAIAQEAADNVRQPQHLRDELKRERARADSLQWSIDRSAWQTAHGSYVIHTLADGSKKRIVYREFDSNGDYVERDTGWHETEDACLKFAIDAALAQEAGRE